MWVIVEREVIYFKHKTIRYWLYILINKIKGKEVYVINEKDI